MLEFLGWVYVAVTVVVFLLSCVTLYRAYKPRQLRKVWPAVVMILAWPYLLVMMLVDEM